MRALFDAFNAPFPFSGAMKFELDFHRFSAMRVSAWLLDLPYDGIMLPLARQLGDDLVDRFIRLLPLMLSFWLSGVTAGVSMDTETVVTFTVVLSKGI
jgi:hypothetical protein